MTINNYCSDPGKLERRKTTSDPDRKGRSGKDNRHNGRHSLTRAFKWVLVCGVVGILAIFAVVGIPLFTSKAPHTHLIMLPQGATLNTLQDSVTKYMGKEFASKVMRAVRFTDGGTDQFRHGAWLIEQGMSAFAAAHRITDEVQAGIRVSLVNERTPRDVAAKIAAKLDISTDSMLNAMRDPALLQQYKCEPEEMMCFLLADTYEYFWDATPRQVINKMHDNYMDFWTPERLQAAEALRLSPKEVAILASIVDEETNDPGEKGIVGRLYVNRMDEGMKLQADPTVRYALKDWTIKRVGGKMLDTNSPYNTYKYEGLPPGPIRIPSAMTMDAILHATPHDYLYMCAKEDFSGSHNFAQTYDEHLLNAKRYQAALDKKGIK